MMRTEFFEYSIVLIFINLPLVINPIMEEAMKMSKLNEPNSLKQSSNSMWWQEAVRLMQIKGIFPIKILIHILP
jgi:hypothetical protein